jgi:glycosyltransferase involved in cell wall biosynthesis
MIGVAICTHNPDERLLARALAAIESQTTQPVECVVVDNNSTPPIASRQVVRDFLARCAWARVVVEPKQGLTFARIAAIEQTTAPFLCFVDDDNEPASDYLASAARILSEQPSIGALGPGQVDVDFVDPVPDWFAQNFRHHFQEKHHDGLTYGCVRAAWTDYYPPGSCLIVRRDVLVRYRERIAAGELSATDRAGAALTSGGDTQIVWEATRLGLAAGISGDLRIAHMIPATRSTLRYMRRLLYGTSSSYLPVLVDSFPEQKAKLPSPPSDGQIARDMLKIIARRVLRMRWKLLPLDLATYAGTATGLLRASNAGERKWLRKSIRLLGLE